MDKRTSDFMSLTAIAVGAGIGLGLTSLFRVGSAPIAQADDVSVEVRVVRDAVESISEARNEHFSVIVTGKQNYRRARAQVLRFRTDLDELERVRANVEYQEALEEYQEVLEELEVLQNLEVLEGPEILEGLDNLTIDILGRDQDEDKRRKRRRRRPREAAPNGSGN